MLQPEGGYRFSLDPLLLACFARVKHNVRMVDLGMGCGVAALAALLRHEASGVSALGLDIDPAMVDAALANAGRLGLADVFQAQQMDICRVRKTLQPESFGLVVCNPPYRPLDTGRTCDVPARTNARFETQGGLEDFLDAAVWLTANRGAVALVYPAERLAGLMHGCVARKLAPKRLRMVHSRLEEQAKLVLLEAVKNGGTGLVVEPPLALYNGQGAATHLCATALEFCPFLACNV